MEDSSLAISFYFIVKWPLSSSKIAKPKGATAYLIDWLSNNSAGPISLSNPDQTSENVTTGARGNDKLSKSNEESLRNDRNKVSRREIHAHIRGRGYISNVALGICDGLVTNIAFLTGFGGAVSEISVIRIAGFAAMLAGSISMFFGGLLAGQSQRDLFKADAARELYEIDSEPEEEKEELRSLYLEKGLTKQEAEILVRRVTSDKRKWLKELLSEELHIHESDLENPLKIALITGLAFLAGAFVPLFPYLFIGMRQNALVASIALSLAFLFLAGFWKGQILRRDRFKSAVQMLTIGAAASSILYVIGLALHIFV
jgi:vacuolar iron transporter family protein